MLNVCFKQKFALSNLMVAANILVFLDILIARVFNIA
jgi:hypothetical protein